MTWTVCHSNCTTLTCTEPLVNTSKHGYLFDALIGAYLQLLFVLLNQFENVRQEVIAITGLELG
jgi:hypothetical protein